jgi:hypothetical protein
MKNPRRHMFLLLLAGFSLQINYGAIAASLAEGIDDAQLAEQTQRMAEETSQQGGQSRFWGRFFCDLGVWSPSFENVLGYEKMYGKSKLAPYISLQYLFYTRGVGVGVGVQFATYSDTGYALNASSRDQISDLSSLSLDKTQETEISIMPLSLDLNFRIPVMGGKYGYLLFAASYDQINVTEGRIASDSTVGNGKIYANRASKTAYSLIPGVAIRITDLRDADNWTYDALGMRAIYFSIMAHYRKTLTPEGIDLSGTSLLGTFSFELM